MIICQNPPKKGNAIAALEEIRRIADDVDDDASPAQMNDALDEVFGLAEWGLE